MEAMKTNVLIWGRSCLRQWKPPFILARINWRPWRSTGIRTSRKFRVDSTSHRNWYWSILRKFWMWTRLKVHIPHGRNRHCLMIKRSTKQSKSTCLLGLHAVSGEDVISKRSSCKMGRSSGVNLDVRFFRELLGIDEEAIESEWNVFPGFTSLQILQKIQNYLP